MMLYRTGYTTDAWYFESWEKVDCDCVRWHLRRVPRHLYESGQRGKEMSEQKRSGNVGGGRAEDQSKELHLVLLTATC